MKPNKLLLSCKYIIQNHFVEIICNLLKSLEYSLMTLSNQSFPIVSNLHDISAIMISYNFATQPYRKYSRNFFFMFIQSSKDDEDDEMLYGYNILYVYT